MTASSGTFPFPDGRDWFNAARGAVHAGIAVSIAPNERSADAVAAAVAALLDEPYRGRA